jgi:transcription-repair coupling factor (superfamily II helicase)
MRISNLSPSRTCWATVWSAAKRRNPPTLLAELAALTPGDLVVHMEHGIGRYEGLQSIPVGGSAHDCVMLTYAGGDKLYVPVENLDVLSLWVLNPKVFRSTSWAAKGGRSGAPSCANVSARSRMNC